MTTFLVMFLTLCGVGLVFAFSKAPVFLDGQGDFYDPKTGRVW